MCDTKNKIIKTMSEYNQQNNNALNGVQTNLKDMFEPGSVWMNIPWAEKYAREIEWLKDSVTVGIEDTANITKEGTISCDVVIDVKLPSADGGMQKVRFVTEERYLRLKDSVALHEQKDRFIADMQRRVSELNDTIRRIMSDWNISTRGRFADRAGKTKRNGMHRP